MFFGKVTIEGKKEIFLKRVEVGEKKIEGVVDDGSVDDGKDVVDGAATGLDFLERVGVLVVGEKLVTGVEDSGNFGDKLVDLIDSFFVTACEAVSNNEVEKAHGVDGEEGLFGIDAEFLGCS